jgi:hypothetical protein
MDHDTWYTWYHERSVGDAPVAARDNERQEDTMGTELDTIRWHLVELRGGEGGDARHEINDAFAGLAKRLAGIEQGLEELKEQVPPVAIVADAESYRILRDVIIEQLDPADDDVAEVAILCDAVEAAVAEREKLREALRKVAYIVKRRERPSGETYDLLAEIAADALGDEGEARDE